MKRVIEILERTQFGFLATIENSLPRIRPFHFQFIIENKFFFCTSSEKEVYRQLVQSSFAEFSVYNKAFEYVIISGQVQFSNDLALKTKVLTNNPFYTDVFESEKDEKMILFYLSNPVIKYGKWGQYPPGIIKY